MRFALAAAAAFFMLTVGGYASPAQSIHTLLSARHAPMAPYGAAFAKAACAHHITPGFLVGVALAETEGGKTGTGRASQGYGAFGVGPGRHYSGYNAAIDDAARIFGRYYIAKGLHSVNAIEAKWVGYPSSEWLAAVKFALARLGGNARDIRSHCGKSKAKAHYPKFLAIQFHQAGPRVTNLQWLLTGQSPSHYKIRSFHGKPNAYYGNKTRLAVWWMKFRLGFPKHGQCRWTGATFSGRLAGGTLHRILLGQETRPYCWIHLASVRAARGIPGKVSLGLAAVERSQLGVREHPDGSNSSEHCVWRVPLKRACVYAYQQATSLKGTGWFWCSAFQVASLAKIGITNYGDRSASVQHVLDWAHARGLVHAIPKAGDLVAYFWTQGGQASHIGFVESVSAGGFFTAIEGNEGNAVTRIGRSLTSGASGPWFMTVRR